MLEPVTLFLTALASAFVITETAFTSIAASLAGILAALVGSLLSLSGLCSALAAIMPPAAEIGVYSKFYSFVNKIAFNVGNAQNRIAKIDDSVEKI